MTKNLFPKYGEQGHTCFLMSFNITYVEDIWTLGHLYIFQAFDFLHFQLFWGGVLSMGSTAKSRDSCHLHPISTSTAADRGHIPWFIHQNLFPVPIPFIPWQTEGKVP